MQRFASCPLLRLLIPFIGGILLYVYFSEHFLSFNLFQHFLFTFLLVIVLAIFLIIQAYKNINLGITVFIDLALIVFGYELCYFQDLRNYDSFLNRHLKTNTQQLLLVKPCDIIVHKDNFSRLIVQSYGLFDTDTKSYQAVNGKVLVYFSNHLKIDSIFHPNRYYLLFAKFKTTKLTENPYAFDYTEYLNRQGIYTTAFISSSNAIIPLSVKQKWNIQEWALFTKYKAVEYFRHNAYLNAYAQSIAAALLTGFDDEMDNHIIQSFSHSGTIHILSVSGFHTGLLFLLISFILNLLDPYKKYRWLRVVSVVWVLFFYAFVAGFSPPILRAAWMLSLIVIQQNFYTNRMIHALNILSAAAFVILCINPFYINDIGFLLSFSAMAGIVYCTPDYFFENRVLQSIWDIVRMSIGAQIGTLPFTLYFFHGFSFIFMLSNLVVVPLVTIIMFVAILALIPFAFFSQALNFLVDCLLKLNAIFSSSYFYYDWFHFTFSDALFLSVFIIFSVRIIHKIKEKEWHWIKYIQFSLFIIGTWLLMHTYFYLQERKKMAVSFYLEKGKLYYWLQHKNKIYFNTFDSLVLSKWGKNLLLKNCVDYYYSKPFNYVDIHNKKILIIHHLRDTILINTLKPNIIVWNNKRKNYLRKWSYTELEKIYYIDNSSSTAVLSLGKAEILYHQSFKTIE